ncbi:MAG: transporter [Methylobacter sp.]|nr:MAG: transporter [Methylobacter sp.]
MDSLFNNLPDWLTQPTLIKWGQAVLGFSLILLVFRILRSTLVKRIKSMETRYHTRKILSFLSYFIIAFYIAGLFSDSLGQLTVILGVVGAGIAFALQEVIASFAGWIAISFGQFYKPGDRVLLGGIMGDVIDINILRTTLMECGAWVGADLYNGRIVRISNSFVFKEPVFNYSADFSFVWDEISIPVKYGSDRMLARELLLKAANDITGEDVETARAQWRMMVHKYLIEDAKVEPMVTLVANDNWLEFTVRYVVTYKLRRSQKDRLYTRILDDFDNTQSKVSIASATFHLVAAPVLDVRFNGHPPPPPGAV